MLINDQKSKDCSDDPFFTDAFRSDLLSIWDSRTMRKSVLKVLQQQTQNFILDAHDKAGIKAFEITLLFPEDQPTYLEESWFLLQGRLFAIEKFFQSLPVYAALVGIEVHKRSKNDPRKENTKELPEYKSLGGRPHIHICLLLFNDFLCPSTISLTKKLSSITQNVDCVEVGFNSVRQVKDWFMYCTKELKDELTQNFLKKYCNLESSCILYSGHSQSNVRCVDLCSVFSRCNLRINLKSLRLFPHFELPLLSGLEAPTIEFPLIPRTKSNLVKVNHFMKALFLHYKLYLWPDKVHTCRLIPNSLCTYERYKPLSEIYSFLLQFFPIEVQELLTQPKALSLYMGEYAKYNLNYLPVISVHSHLIELSDGIYNFLNGEYTRHSESTPSLRDVENKSYISCVSFWPHLSFDTLPWPSTPLSIVDRLYEKPQMNVFHRFCISFGNLFHYKQSLLCTSTPGVQKTLGNNLSIYLYGPPGSGKSSLMEEILGLVLGPKVGFIRNHKGPYKLCDIKNKSLAIFKEFHFSQLAEDDVLGLVEGAQVVIEEKNKEPFLLNADLHNSIHTIAITTEDWPISESLQRRFVPYYLQGTDTTSDEKKIEFDKNVRREAVSFCIYANLHYLRDIKIIGQIPSDWLQECDPSWFDV